MENQESNVFREHKLTMEIELEPTKKRREKRGITEFKSGRSLEKPDQPNDLTSLTPQMSGTVMNSSDHVNQELKGMSNNDLEDKEVDEALKVERMRLIQTEKKLQQDLMPWRQQQEEYGRKLKRDFQSSMDHQFRDKGELDKLELRENLGSPSPIEEEPDRNKDGEESEVEGMKKKMRTSNQINGNIGDQVKDEHTDRLQRTLNEVETYKAKFEPMKHGEIHSTVRLNHDLQTSTSDILTKTKSCPGKIEQSNPMQIQHVFRKRLASENIHEIGEADQSGSDVFNDLHYLKQSVDKWTDTSIDAKKTIQNDAKIKQSESEETSSDSSGDQFQTPGCCFWKFYKHKWAK